MTYILENKAEADRLKLQDNIEAYDLNLDLGDFEINENDKVLDAGCGSGIVSLFLKKNFKMKGLDSCDFSELRMKQAQKYLLEHRIGNVSFFQCDLENIPQANNSYDKVVCRFVYEYLKAPELVTKEFYRVCKPGGQVRVIDLDGVVCNLQSNNSELTQMLNHLTKSALEDHHLDFFAGRKLYSHMMTAGFKDIEYKARPMLFKGEDLQKEIHNYTERFAFARSLLDSVFNGHAPAQRFIDTYLAELAKKDSLLFYNNFVVTGKKPA